MKNKIILKNNIPSKKNSKIIVCRGTFPILLPSSNYTKWHKDALEQLIGVKPIKSNKLTITFIAENKRKFDLSNRAESVMDLLVDAGLIEDDNYTVISDLHLKFGGVDKDKVGCIIEF